MGSEGRLTAKIFSKLPYLRACQVKLSHFFFKYFPFLFQIFPISLSNLSHFAYKYFPFLFQIFSIILSNLFHFPFNSQMESQRLLPVTFGTGRQTEVKPFNIFSYACSSSLHPSQSVVVSNLCSFEACDMVVGGYSWRKLLTIDFARWIWSLEDTKYQVGPR